LGAGTSTLTYTYDAAGRRTQMQVTGQTAVTYGYDDAHRITGITQGTNVVGFTYDAASRRTLATLPNGVTIAFGVGPTQPPDIPEQRPPKASFSRLRTPVSKPEWAVERERPGDMDGTAAPPPTTPLTAQPRSPTRWAAPSRAPTKTAPAVSVEAHVPQEREALRAVATIASTPPPRRWRPWAPAPVR